MSFDYQKLRAKIVEKFGTQDKFAEAYGISRVALSQKMNNKTKFTYNDIVQMSKMLDINVDDIGDYFFTNEV